MGGLLGGKDPTGRFCPTSGAAEQWLDQPLFVLRALVSSSRRSRHSFSQSPRSAAGSRPRGSGMRRQARSGSLNQQLIRWRASAWSSAAPSQPLAPVVQFVSEPDPCLTAKACLVPLVQGAGILSLASAGQNRSPGGVVAVLFGQVRLQDEGFAVQPGVATSSSRNRQTKANSARSAASRGWDSPRNTAANLSSNSTRRSNCRNESASGRVGGSKRGLSWTARRNSHASGSLFR